jgi:hypothetical protein
MRLSFPPGEAIGELEWPGGTADVSGVVEVPDGVPVTLYVSGDEAVSLEFLRRLPADGIMELHLQYPLVADSFGAVTHLAPGLRILHLVGTELSDAALGSVAQLHGLIRLYCFGNQFTRSGLQQLAGLAQLEYLALGEDDLFAADLQFAAALPHLRQLRGLEEAGMDQTQLSAVRAMVPRASVS